MQTLIPFLFPSQLEQVDQMFEESTPRTSAKWVPHEKFQSGHYENGLTGTMSHNKMDGEKAMVEERV